MDSKSLIDHLRSAILDAYDQVNRAVPERDRKQQSQTHLADWFNSSTRLVSDAASACADRYLTTEFDFLTPGNRGLGRMSEFEPRFAAKHRELFQRNRSAVDLLKPLFVRHLFLGYCFLEYLLESFNGSPLPRDPKCTTEMLFSQWVPMLYSSFGAANFDSQMEKQYGSEAAYLRVKHFWMATTVRPVFGSLQDIGIVPDEQDKLIFARYFDAGIVLRLLESKPLSQEEERNVVTGGAYSAEKSGTLKPSGGGCAVLIATLCVVSLIGALALK